LQAVPLPAGLDTSPPDVAVGIGQFQAMAPASSVILTADRDGSAGWPQANAIRGRIR
jgi:hypothetical protein